MRVKEPSINTYIQTKNIIDKSRYQSHPTWERFVGIIGKHENRKKLKHNKTDLPPRVKSLVNKRALELATISVDIITFNLRGTRLSVWIY